MKKRELTISEELELDWNDRMHSPSDERYLRKEFEEGLKDLEQEFKNSGHDSLMFDIKALML